uniref:Uncharacterized protein n=1 Tax=Tanacetum cinerariifolium TaxID=118510 RepID=A0A6L2J0D4_TANCI|nr:hypothetical protein [Tanacetum cinerariifolium]
MPLKRDLRLIDEHFESESVDVSTVSSSDDKTVKIVDVKCVVSKEEPKPVKKNSFSPSIIEDWVFENSCASIKGLPLGPNKLDPNRLPPMNGLIALPKRLPPMNEPPNGLPPNNELPIWPNGFGCNIPAIGLVKKGSSNGSLPPNKFRIPPKPAKGSPPTPKKGSLLPLPPCILLQTVYLKSETKIDTIRFGGGRGRGDPFFGMGGDPFAGILNLFGGRDPFDDPFFTNPMARMLQPNPFGHMGSSLLGGSPFGGSFMGGSLFSNARSPFMGGSPFGLSLLSPSGSPFMDAHESRGTNLEL